VTSTLTGKPDLSSLSYEAAINKLMDNYVVLSKSVIEGISGRLCIRCYTFDFSYIKKIGFDLTEGERHRCGPERLHEEDLYILTEIDAISTDCLVGLTYSLFGHTICLTCDSTPSPLYSEPNISGNVRLRTGGFHAPVIAVDSIENGSHYKWLKKSIDYREFILNRDELRDFIHSVYGTYAVIKIKAGNYAGIYRMKLKSCER